MAITSSKLIGIRLSYYHLLKCRGNIEHDDACRRREAYDTGHQLAAPNK